MAWGRIALLDAAGEGEDTLEKMADVFGYKQNPTAKSEKPKQQQTAKGESLVKPDLTTDPDEPVQQRKPARFIRVREITYHEQEQSERPAYLTDPNMMLSADAGGTYSFDPPRRLLPLSRLLPFLLNNLGQQRSGSRLDHRRITRKIAQGKALHKLPHIPKQRWPQRLQIIVDTGAHLEPFWDDFASIVKSLQGLLGKEAVEAITLNEETLDQALPLATPWPMSEDDFEDYWVPPRSDMPVLILSDLGVTARQHQTRVRWRRFAERLHLHPAPILTLSPASHAPSCLYSCHRLQVNPLNDGAGLPRHALKRGYQHVPLAKNDLQNILAQLSPLPLIDAGLLRKLRDELDWGDSEIEAKVWNHPDMVQTGLGIYLRSEVAEGYRQRYVNKFSETETDKKLWQTVKEHHTNAFEGIRHFEGFNQASLGGDTSVETLNYMKRLAATTSQSRQGSDYHHQLIQQCKSFLSFCPESYSSDVLSDLVHEIFVLAYRKEIEEGNWQATPLKGVQLEKVEAMLKLDKKDRDDWLIRQIGDQGQVLLLPALEAGGSTHSILSFSALKKIPATVRKLPSSESMVLESSQALEIDAEGVLVQSSRISVVLESITKPSWANSITTLDNGVLGVNIQWGDETKSLHWRYMQDSQGMSKGRWHSDEIFGHDEYGLYADVEIAPKITQRFRWMEPGTFSMGSPETEPEHLNTEIQHEVKLSNGYWLADTTVTQEQWQAILGESPSHFKGENLPVEKVSWDDSQHFIQQLNKRHQSLTFQLPTDAHWEYACRAGTATPFSFGENITSDEVNYDGDYPYDNGQKWESRNKTVPVKSLPPSKWGLYEMHGNVWEWCQDNWLGNLGKEAVTDPKYDASEKGAERVIRGGSWIYDGRDARSAYRYNFSPDYRSNLIGLRLSLGQPSGSSRGGSRFDSQSRPAASSASRVAEQRPAGVGDGLLAGAQRVLKGLFGGKNEK